jgi:pimeloyl-ACP methyl ester carboxylesterase
MVTPRLLNLQYLPSFTMSPLDNRASSEAGVTPPSQDQHSQSGGSLGGLLNLIRFGYINDGALASQNVSSSQTQTDSRQANMSTSSPVIVILPGPFSSPQLYEAVVAQLMLLGYDVQVVPHLTAREPGGRPPTMYDDATQARSYLKMLVEQRRDIILVGHSYGAAVAAQCCKKLGRDERRAQGREGGITRLLMVAGTVPAERKTVMESMNGRAGIQASAVQVRTGGGDTKLARLNPNPTFLKSHGFVTNQFGGNHHRTASWCWMWIA